MTSQLRRFYLACFAAYVLIFVGFLAAGCASSNQALVQADTTIHSALASLDDKAHAFCKANEQFKVQCADLNPVMVSLLKAGDTFNRGVANQTPAGLLDLASAGTAVYKELQKLPTSATVEMFKELARALASAAALSGGAK